MIVDDCKSTLIYSQTLIRRLFFLEELVFITVMVAKRVFTLLLRNEVFMIDFIIAVLAIITTVAVITNMVCRLLKVISGTSLTKLIVFVDDLPHLVIASRAVHVCRLIGQSCVDHGVLTSSDRLRIPLITVHWTRLVRRLASRRI